MHDPMTVAFEIPNPFRWRRDPFSGKLRFDSLAAIWHVDPENDGTDDSCGWFMRARHCDQVILKKIISDFDFNWDADYGAWFDKSGVPVMSPIGITVNMFWSATYNHFNCNRRKANAFMRSHLFDIIHFAENPVDSLRNSIVGKYGMLDRETRIEQFAQIVYSWVARECRPWWKHPKFHIHHWKIQIHVINKLKRFLFSRCERCGKRFPWGYSPISGSWDSEGPRWFKSEKQAYHHDCRDLANEAGPVIAEEKKEA